jgi:2-keto-4-pentenoate hydratase
MNTSIPILAQRQLADYDKHRPSSMFRNGAGILTASEAYGLQIEVAKLRIERGEALAGYKVGCTNAAIRTQLGLYEPVWGHVFATEIAKTGDVLRLSRFDCLGVEGEFAFRINQDIPNSDWLRENRSRAVVSAFPVIELHNYVFRAGIPTTEELIANNALHAGVVLPVREPRVWDPVKLHDEEISIRRNGETVAVASGREVDSTPLESLMWLADQLREFGFHLKRNHVVLTGSPLPMVVPHPGDRIAVQCNRLGSAECLYGRSSKSFF